MIRVSKLIKSRDGWKKKAIEKTYEAKEARKAKRYYKVIANLREENKKLKEEADMSLSALMIPTFCGTLNEMQISQALKKVNYKDLKDWEEKNVRYTLCKERQKCFKESVQK